MRAAELPLTCELCDGPSEYYDSVPSAAVPGYSPSEAGYRLQPLCWLHAVDRRHVATSRVKELLRCEQEGVARVDHGRACGLCYCSDCGRRYYDHPANSEFPFLQQLCDGSVVKL